MNTYLKLPKEEWVQKNSKIVEDIKEWVDAQYDDGRVTVLTDEELLTQIKKSADKLGVHIRGVN